VNSNESNAAPEGLAADVPSDAKSATAAERARAGLGRAQWLVVIAGLLAGLVSFAIGEAVHEIIPAAKEEVNLMGNKSMVVNRSTSMAADARNGALTFALLGLCLGGCLGLAGGLARRSTSGAVTGSMVGSLFGIALGAGVSLALLPRCLAMRYEYFKYDLLISLVMHGLIWGLLGAAAGLAYAVGIGKPRLSGQAVTAGFTGAVLGAVVFELVGSAFCEAARTGEVISGSWQTRLMARLLVTLGTAVVIALLLPDSPKNAVSHQTKLGTATPES